ncbi:MAG: site-2 protease family protein [Candidatus Marsarchaeota archaeon]|jgi:hypothetical protein|nr:site-2 protease family protein [Candidatus Marsarchaeota archaeon]
MAAAKAGKQHNKLKPAASAALVVVTFALLVLVYYLNLGSSNWVIGIKFIAALAVLMLAGTAIRRINSFEGASGLYIFGGRYGIKAIEWVAGNRKTFWEFFAEVGLVMSFGALSYFIFKGQIRKSALVSGLILVTVLLFIIFPFIVLSLQFITIPGIHKITIQSVPLGFPPLDFLTVIELISIFAGGLALFVVALLAYASASIAYSLFSFTSSVVVSHAANYTILQSQIPALEPVLPGVTIPLFAGILALAVVLVVHESSHGILSTIYRTKVKRVGLLIFGVIPIGAFVDPGEKQIAALSKEKQNKILIAGITANYFFTFIFFIFSFLMLYYVMPGLYKNAIVISAVLPNSPANGILTAGSVVTSWNGHNVTNSSSIENAARSDAPGSIVKVLTNTGNYSITANSTGKIGVDLEEQQMPAASSAYFSISNFLYQFVVLAFALNLLVAIFNLLPLPLGFDGMRIYQNVIKNNSAKKALILFVVIIMIILILPWIWWLLGI